MAESIKYYNIQRKNLGDNITPVIQLQGFKKQKNENLYPRNVKKPEISKCCPGLRWTR